MNEVSKFERVVNQLRDAVPPPSPKKERRPDNVNHSVVRKETTLSSVFTQPIDAHQINSVDEIVEQNFQMYVDEQNHPLLNVTRAWKIYSVFQNTIVTDSPTKSLQMLASGGKKVAIISRVIYENNEMFFRDHHGRPKLHLVKDAFAHVWSTTYLKRGHRHLEMLRKLELQTKEAGILSKIVQDNEFRRKIKYPSDDAINRDPDLAPALNSNPDSAFALDSDLELDFGSLQNDSESKWKKRNPCSFIISVRSSVFHRYFIQKLQNVETGEATAWDPDDRPIALNEFG
ncbi:hypothetical protein EVAR_9599_1 [Eumeta japonica]|uniref:Uncharacterized protein n=1 Tax=Eumeta variegata TaxID=151549 RepID=A0A4C1TJK1_EUMVA|nr:hypothetical protein EVAR_9599_1 [Eumeta japonica]